MWVTAHGGFVPIAPTAVTDVAEGDPTTVTALVGAEPHLDPVLGLVPYRSRVTYVVVEEEGVWRISSAQTTRQPLFPADEGAAQAAQVWAERRAACEPTDDLEEGLVGQPAVAEALCTAGGAVRVGPAAALTDSDAATALLSAYGPEVFAWARVVRVEEPAPVAVVLGPFGADWRVVGVLPTVG